MKPEQVWISIFSFNRGLYLANLLKSIWANFPAGIRIEVFDDDSDDPLTLAVLELAQQAGVLVQNSDKQHSPLRSGNLRSNMQRAFEGSEASLHLFLQDDQQIIRNVRLDELQQMQRFLQEERSSSPLLAISFLKNSKERRGKLGTFHTVEVVGSGNARWYQIFKASGEPSFATPIVAFDPGRLKASGWRFRSSDSENAAFAKSAGWDPVPMWLHPFLSFLPWPESFRFKEKTIAQALWERRRTSFNPYVPMSKRESDMLLSRDVTEAIPYAEDWLRTEDPKVKKPWRFSGFLEAPRLVHGASRVEKLAKRLFGQT